MSFISDFFLGYMQKPLIPPRTNGAPIVVDEEEIEDVNVIDPILQARIPSGGSGRFMRNFFLSKVLCYFYFSPFGLEWPSPSVA